MRQLVYTMFIRNNCISFHLWWKASLVKHREVSKYYETDCSFKYLLIKLSADESGNIEMPNGFFEQNLLVVNGKSKYHHWFLHIWISLGTNLPKMGIFSPNHKGKHDHWVMHIRISLGNKFQLNNTLSYELWFAQFSTRMAAWLLLIFFICLHSQLSSTHFIIMY